MELKIVHRVNLLPADSAESCWAAAASMLYGGGRPLAARWPKSPPAEAASDPDSPDAPAVAVPPHLASGTLAQFAHEWALELLPPRQWGVADFAELLKAVPLWTGAYRPNGHAMVLTGLFGDGSPGGTYVTALDPLPESTGAVLRLPFSVWAHRYSLPTMHVLYRPARVSAPRPTPWEPARAEEE